jgi:regulatory protein
VPIITNVLERRKGTWVQLFADNGESVRLPVEQALGVHRGDGFTPLQWDQLKADSEYWVLYDKALRLLGMREHFTVELRRKLQQRSMNRLQIDKVLAACVERGYLDDARAANYIATMLVQRGGIGKLRLKADLRARGCPDVLIDATVERFAGELDERAALEALLGRKRSHFESKRDRLRDKLVEEGKLNGRQIAMQVQQKLAAAVSAFAYGRGFAGDDAHRAVRKFVDALVEEDSL